MTRAELHVRVGGLRVVGPSTVDARRLADALPEALERALASTAQPDSRASTTADEVAREVAGRIRASLPDPAVPGGVPR